MESKETKYSHILKYTGLFGGIQGLSALINVLRNKLVVLLLGPEGMGLIALFNTSMKWMSDSTNLGLPISAVREVSNAYENDDTEELSQVVKVIRSWSLMTAMLGLSVCMVLSPFLSRWTFKSADHTLDFILLSPIVALMALTGGELAVLKGVRQLRRLAEISVYNVFIALLVSVPMFYFWHEAAIIPSLLIIAVIQMLVTIVWSYRLFPPRFSWRRTSLGKGVNMIWLGISLAVAGILGSGAEFAIRAFLNQADSLDVVGLYSAGYAMPMLFAGLVFSALDSEYYPRISGIQGTGDRLNEAVNSQIEVCLLLLSPMLMAFLFSLPILLPLLYSGKFLPVLGMMQVMVIAVFLRALCLPVAYLPLAKADSRSYLLMESCYDVAVVLLVVVCFRHFGLVGCGVGILVTMLLDVLLLYSYMHWRFQYTVSVKVVKYVLIHLPLLLIGYVATSIAHPVAYWLTGILLTAVSMMVSLYILHSQTHLWEQLSSKLRSRWKK